jgi:UTP:GlnB (protein PII) uridylyltransferase
VPLRPNGGTMTNRLERRALAQAATKPPDIVAIGVRAGIPLRHALRALACHPDVRRSPREWISSLRPTLDAERERLGRRFRTGGLPADHQRDWSRAIDGAVLGVCHLARVCADAPAPSVVAPLAVLAVGDYGKRQCDVEAVPELLFLLAPDGESRRRAERMIPFILTGLGELGLAMHYAIQTPAICAGAVATLAHGRERLATMRHLWGRNDLRAQLDDELQRRGFAPAVEE